MNFKSSAWDTARQSFRAISPRLWTTLAERIVYLAVARTWKPTSTTALSLASGVVCVERHRAICEAMRAERQMVQRLEPWGLTNPPTQREDFAALFKMGDRPMTVRCSTHLCMNSTTPSDTCGAASAAGDHRRRVGKRVWRSVPEANPSWCTDRRRPTAGCHSCCSVQARGHVAERAEAVATAAPEVTDSSPTWRRRLAVLRAVVTGRSR